MRPIHFPAPDKLLSPPIIATDDVDVGYEPGQPVLSGLSLRIDNDDRIALLGSNGNGKSTLVKLLAGRLAPEHGTRHARGQRSRSAISPSISSTSSTRTQAPTITCARLMPDAAGSESARASVGAIGFSGLAGNNAVKTLSGGEKARLLLGLATFTAPHLVILDEPTNHLDIDSRAALIEAINDFPGAVILVSHDRYLLEACADRLWLVQGGTVKPFDGDLDDYRRRCCSAIAGQKRSRATKSAPRTDPADARRAAADKRAETAPLAQTHVARPKSRSRSSHGNCSKLDTTLADGALFARDPARAADLSKTRANVVAAIAKAEEEWLAASAALETA